MEIYSLVIIVAVLVIVIVVITRPYFTAVLDQDSIERHLSSDILQSEYEEIINRIQQLDIEYQQNKMDSEDYASMRQNLKIQAAQHLQKIKAVKTSDQKAADSP